MTDVNPALVSAAQAMEAERSLPSPTSGRHTPYSRLMGQMRHYAEGVGINWLLFADGLEALKERFETDNAIVALERLFITLEQDGRALMAKRRKR